MPGPNVTQVHEENCFISLSINVNSAAVPPPSECPMIYGNIIITIKKGQKVELHDWIKRIHKFNLQNSEARIWHLK